MSNNQLSIRLHGNPIGILEQTISGKKIFTYHDNATTAISLSMPIRKEPYHESQCEAFFGGLLPESETAKKLLGKKYGISPNNSFALLKAIGYDCAGAISCHAIDEPVLPQKAVPLTGRIISEKQLYKHIKELPKKPLFMDVAGLRLSLAGVQDKAAICLIDNQVTFPEKGCPTTHILKPASPHFEGIVENEYFIMRIAKRVGLSVPEVELRKINDICFLLIKRYDRKIKNNCVERIHQEDFCQALSISSSKKYQNEHGPGFKECFELLNNTVQPAVDRNQLMSAVVFNYLIGNMDAHGKNFSLLHHSATDIRLAPFYDIVCTRAYPELTSKMAMKIGSKYTANQVLLRHWQQLSDSINYRHLALANLIESLGKKIQNSAAQEKELLQTSGINNPIIDRIANFIEKNIEKTLHQFQMR
ncbi:MAG: type II toxin-antitoxin system HipA family toxin [Gammaproteobacteria bacterium]